MVDLIAERSDDTDNNKDRITFFSQRPHIIRRIKWKIRKEILETRIHYSRMRTARSLTVSLYIVVYAGGHACHAHPPAMHALLPHMFPCHAHPLPCMPPAMHAACHTCTPCHACCLPHMPPATPRPPAMHAPCHTCPPAMHAPCHAHPCHTHLLPHMSPMPCMPSCYAHPPATHAPHEQNDWQTGVKT